MRRPNLLLTLAVLGLGAVALFVDGQDGLGLVALAGIAGVLATTGLLRRFVGVILALTGVLAVVAVDGSLLGLVGAVLVILAGAAVVGFAQTWRGLSGRYATGAGAGGRVSGESPTDIWRALDRGDDPTAFPDEDPTPGCER